MPCGQSLHVGVRRARRVVPLIVLARPRQRGELVVNVLARRDGRRLRVRTAAAAAGKRRAHHHHRAEHVRPHQRAPGRDRRAEIVADHGRDRAIAEREDQPKRVPHHVEHAERAPGRRRSSRPIRWCGHSRAGPARPRGSRRPRAAASPCASDRPARESRAAAAGTAGRRLEPGLQHVHAQAVDVLDEARADARRQKGAVERRQFRHHYTLWTARRGRPHSITEEAERLDVRFWPKADIWSAPEDQLAYQAVLAAPLCYYEWRLGSA